MNSNDARIGAQTISGLQLDETTSFLWVKDGIRELLSKYYKAGKIIIDTIVANADTEYPLSKELVMIENVKTESGSPVSPNFGYSTDNANNIIFADGGTYRVRYYSQPDPPSAKTTPLPIPIQYHSCLEYYLAHRIRARLFGGGDDDAASYYQSFLDSASGADIALQRQNRRGRRMPPRR